MGLCGFLALEWASRCTDGGGYGLNLRAPSDVSLFSLFMRRLAAGCTQAGVKSKCARVLAHLYESDTPWTTLRSEGLWMDIGDVQHMALWFPVVLWGPDIGRGCRRVMYPSEANGPLSQGQVLGTASCLAQVVLDSDHFHPLDIPALRPLVDMCEWVPSVSSREPLDGPAVWPWGGSGGLARLHQPSPGVTPGGYSSPAPRKRSSLSPQRPWSEALLGDGESSVMSPSSWDPGWRPIGSSVPNAWHKGGSMGPTEASEELLKRSCRAQPSGSRLDGPGAEEVKDGFEDCGVDGPGADAMEGLAEGVKGGPEDRATDGADADAAGSEGLSGPAGGEGAHPGVCMEGGGKGAPGGGPEDPLSGKGDTRVDARKRCGDELGEGDGQKASRMRVASYPD